MRARLNVLIGILMIAGLLLLSACPQDNSGGDAPKLDTSVKSTDNSSAGTADDNTAGNGGDLAETEADDEPAADDAEADEAEDVDGESDDASSEEASLPRPVKPDGRPVLEGEWFALFGKTEIGPVEHMWMSGHRVDFRRNGQAFWIVVEDGAQTATMDSQWSRSGNTIKLSFLGSRAVETGLRDIAPMGIGKDEEIGLASGQAPGTNSSAMNLFDANLQYQLDHNYLVLTDGNERTMVYGRVRPEPTELGGSEVKNWLGYFNRREAIGANLAVRGNSVTLQYDRDQSLFTGSQSGGYVIGRVESPGGQAIAALTLTSDGQLDGIIMKKPYQNVDSDFEFVPWLDQDQK